MQHVHASVSDMRRMQLRRLVECSLWRDPVVSPSCLDILGHTQMQTKHKKWKEKKREHSFNVWLPETWQRTTSTMFRQNSPISNSYSTVWSASKTALMSLCSLVSYSKICDSECGVRLPDAKTSFLRPYSWSTNSEVWTWLPMQQNIQNMRTVP